MTICPPKKILVTGGSGLIGSYLKKIMPEGIYVNSKDFNLLKESDVKNMFNDNNIRLNELYIMLKLQRQHTLTIMYLV